MSSVTYDTKAGRLSLPLLEESLSVPYQHYIGVTTEFLV